MQNSDKHFLLRLNPELDATIKVLAKHSGKSQNSFMNELLLTGLQQFSGENNE